VNRPRLQIALDKVDLPSALAPLQKAAPSIDIIECGTVLILAEGLRAVREIRALFPDKEILADIRIAEAGKLLSTMAFEAGASLVSVVAGASMNTVKQVCQVAAEHGGEVQIELADEWYDAAKAQQWRDAGAQHVIVKRSRDREAAGDLSWGEADIARVDELAAMGFTVTITGGIKLADLETFRGHPVGIIIAGRSVAGSDDPLAAAAELQAAIGEVWS
jgi:3-dehydro-L-gulonate-6-phosphate decarboxylase